MRTFIGFFVVFAWADFRSCQAQPQRGDVVYRNDFDTPTLQLPVNATLDQGPDASQALRIQRLVEQGIGDAGWRVPIDLRPFRGAKIKVEAQVKAKDVAKPEHPWNGVKVMLQMATTGATLYPQQNDVDGSFDWKTIKYTTAVPTDVTQAWLILGLEQTTGMAWFDDVVITVVSPPHLRPAHPPAGPMFTGHQVPRLRGTMVSPNMTEADLRVLGGEWKANHLRWQLNWGAGGGGQSKIDDPAGFDRWVDRSLDQMDASLPLCRALGVVVLIDLHTMPGEATGNSNLMFSEPRWQDEFVAVWQKIARRYKGNPTIWGYDLANEPIDLGGDEEDLPAGATSWHRLATRAAEAVRTIDAKHAIIIEPTPGADPGGFAELDPIPVAGIVYSVHMYHPHEFTHQGVGQFPKGPTSYPGEINGTKWDKEQMRKTLQPVRDFQLAYNVQIYAGEFSAIRWAPGDSAYNYLHDLIEIFEEYGWDWDYHAFREYDGWSVESGGNREEPQRLTVPTKRQVLLRAWFAKNERAGIAR